MKSFSLILILILSSNYSSSYQILGILPFETKSHFAIGESMMKALAEFFHNVTVVSPYPQNQELHFFKDVSIASDEMDGEYVEGKIDVKILIWGLFINDVQLFSGENPPPAG